MLAVGLFTAAVALAAPALAQTSVNSVSIIAVLATALPQSLVNLALTNPGAASSIIKSEFDAGHTPAWFSGLPSDIQTYLVPVTTIPQPPGVIVSALPTRATALQTLTYSPVSTATGSTVHANSTTYRYGTGTAGTAGTAGTRPSNSTVTSLRMNMTPTSVRTSTQDSSAASSSAPTSSPTGNAAVAPTAAVLGAGLMGAIGLFGLLAL